MIGLYVSEWIDEHYYAGYNRLRTVVEVTKWGHLANQRQGYPIYPLRIMRRQR